MKKLLNGEIVDMTPEEEVDHLARFAPSSEQIQSEIAAAVQDHLDAEARTHGYDGVLSLASYAASTHPRFAAEGRAGADWRDAVWGYCYQVLADVQSGNRGIPEVEQVLAELPVMVWP